MSNRTRLETFIETVWNRGDISALGSMVAPAYTIHRDPGDPWEGQTLTVEGLGARVTASRAAAPDQRFTIRQVIEDRARICIAWDWEGTHSAPIGDVPATGRRITMTGMTLYFFDDSGLITGHWQVADRLGVYRQVAQ